MNRNWDSPGSRRAVIRALLARELGVEISEITPDLHYGAIAEWDSVNHMHLVAALEDEFSIYFDDETIGELSSLKSIEDAVERLVS